MENSFYYFFSATPQVLGSILALFGVFVLFKLQSLSTELITIGDNIYNYYCIKITDIKPINETNTIYESNYKAIDQIKNAISVKKIKDIKKGLDKITNFKNQPFLTDKAKFDSVYNIYKNLIDSTISATIFTGAIIVYCLALLPFAKYLSCHSLIVYLLFAVTLITVSIIFILLIRIIKNSIQ
jgi:hypothetical protein